MLHGVVFLGAGNRRFLEERTEITQNICLREPARAPAPLGKHTLHRRQEAVWRGRTVNEEEEEVCFQTQICVISCCVFF